MSTPQLNTSRIHSNSKKRDRNLSPSKVNTLFYKVSVSLTYNGILTTWILTGLFKNRKCQGTQHRLGWCSAMILPNLSHFYNVKKMVQGVWNIFCLVQAVMEGPKWPIFWDPAPFFLPYKNGSNLVESLLSTISSFAEIPGIFDFWKDQLVVR